AYRHSDLKSVHSRQQHQRQQQAPLGRFAGTDSLTAKVMNVGEDDSRYTDSDVSWSQKAEQQEDGETKEKMEPQLTPKREQHHLAENEYPKRSLSESKTSRLPFVVENGARGPENWDTDPLGQHPECPSSPRVFQVGIAMDTGYFKASTGFGVDQSGNSYGGNPELTLEEAIDLAESEVQGIVSLVNVLFTDQFGVYIEVKHIEIRVQTAETTEDQEQEQEQRDPLEANWNHEPLDHTKSHGQGRLEYGCPYSRLDGTEETSPNEPSSDHFSTLKGFAAWRESLPPEDRLGVWQLLTACYDEGVEGLSYTAAACSDSMGVGWVSRRTPGTWDVLAQELGHSLGSSGFLDIAKDSTWPTGGRESTSEMGRSESRKEVCRHIISNEECFQPYEPTCGNGILEPGEDCDDDSPCCRPNQCKLVPNARCSPGSSWWKSRPTNNSSANPAVVAHGDWMGQCCTVDCQFLSSATLCRVPGGSTGVCVNGDCRRAHVPIEPYGSYETCVSPDSFEFNACVEHYRPVGERQLPSTASPERNTSHSLSNETSTAEGLPISPEGQPSDDSNHAQDCMEESAHWLPEGTVCDHESYKECSANSKCVAVTPPPTAAKRTVNHNEGKEGFSKRGLNNGHTNGARDADGKDVRYSWDSNNEEDGDEGDENQESSESSDSDDQEGVGGDSAEDVEDSVFSLVYRGCFQDGFISKDLRGGTRLFHEELSAHKCGEWCAARGSLVMGLQNGRRCSCGDDFGGSGYRRLSEDQCDIACSGDRTQRCGSFGTNSIYSILYNDIRGGHDWELESGTSGTGILPATSARPAWYELGHSDGGVGRQGLGINAGNRIKRTWDGQSRRSVLVYYNDETAEWKKGGEERGANDSIAEAKHELERKQHGQGDELEYLGCFRDHPDPLREFSRAGRPQDTVDNEAEEEQEDSLMESQQPWRQQGHHDEDGVHVFRSSLTANVCKVQCMAIGKPFFGLQFGRECRCGDNPPYNDPAGNCVSPCTGDRSQVCGGAWANTVYRIRGINSGDTSYTPLETFTTTATLAPAPMPAHRDSTPRSTPTHLPAECRQQGRSKSSTDSPTPTRCAELLGEEHAENALVPEDTYPEDGERQSHNAGRRRWLSHGTGEQRSAHSNDDAAYDDDGGSDNEGDDDAEEEDRDQDDKDNKAIDVADDIPTLLPYKVIHPLMGEFLTTGAIASVTWAATQGLDEGEGNRAQGVELWLIDATGGIGTEALIAEGVDTDCMVAHGETCRYTFAVPRFLTPEGGPMEATAEKAFMLELRGLDESHILGRSQVFFIVEKTAFTFLAPRGGTGPVRGSVTEVLWESAGGTKDVWIELCDADTGRVAAVVGATANTGSVQWVVPLYVQEGVYYFVIRPLHGQRLMESTEASELFLVADPSPATTPPLALTSPVLGEYVPVGAKFLVTWTSPDIARVKITLQNEWEWEAETLLFEGVNGNEFDWQVPEVSTGAGYYLQLEDADEHHDGWQGHRIIGGVGETEFNLIGRGVRTRSFTIGHAQPEVSLGNIFRGQTGHVWTKDVALRIEVSNAGQDESGPLPVLLELMQGGRPVWTVPGSSTPISGSSVQVTTTMPRFEPEDGLYYLKATSMLHHQAADVSPEFGVISYLPTEWAGASSTLKLDNRLHADVFEPGQSYYISWSTTFVGRVTVQLKRANSDQEREQGERPMLLERGETIPNTGGFWFTIPFRSELGVDWCPGRRPKGGNRNGNSSKSKSDVGATADTSSSSDDDDVDNSCCFTLSVSDARDAAVRDDSDVFCIDDAGDSSREERDTTLEIVKFPTEQWELDKDLEIRWASKHLHSPVVINLLGPEIEPATNAEDEDDGDDESDSQESSDSAADNDEVRKDFGEDGNGEGGSDAHTTVRRRVKQLGSGLPATGSLVVPVSQMADVAPGDDYVIEVRDDSGKARSVSPSFEMIAPPGISISNTIVNATANKGDSCRIEWTFTGKPFPVRVQLFSGSPIPVTTSGTTCVPFKTTDSYSGREVQHTGCVQDPTSPYNRQCATQIDRDSRPRQTGYCAKPAQYMKASKHAISSHFHVMWQSDEVQVSKQATDVIIPRDEFELPTVGPSYFWKARAVTSTLNPQVHSESETFSLGYPSTLLSFRTRGLSPGDIVANNTK
ncbi:unnamed protein product, partial [Ectocarpus sp. 12 AP-2014]